MAFFYKVSIRCEHNSILSLFFNTLCFLFFFLSIELYCDFFTLFYNPTILLLKLNCFDSIVIFFSHHEPGQTFGKVCFAHARRALQNKVFLSFEPEKNFPNILLTHEKVTLCMGQGIWLYRWIPLDIL